MMDNPCRDEGEASVDRNIANKKIGHDVLEEMERKLTFKMNIRKRLLKFPGHIRRRRLKEFDSHKTH